MGNASSDAWGSCFNEIKTTHDQAYRVIEEAINLEEQERQHDAIEKYKEGIMLIDKALTIQVTFPEDPTDDFQKACSMIQKMKKTRAEVLTRIHSIQSSPNFTPLPAPPPPSYDEAVGGVVVHPPRTYVDLATALDNLKVADIKDGAEVIYEIENVRLYYIAPSGEVTATAEGQTLQIAVIEGQQIEPKAFLKIGDWTYPLVPGVSPCYRTNYGAFIFPDLHSDIPDASVAFMLPEGSDEDIYDLLESILHGIVGEVARKEPRSAKDQEAEEGATGSAFSSKITTGSYYISQGLIKGAEKTGSFLNYVTPKIINNLTPSAEPRQVPTTLGKGLRVAKTATNTAANATGFVADKVGEATTKLGRFLAPHIRKQGTRILTTGFNLSEKEANSKVDGVLSVAAGAIEGFSTVYHGLETSASILGNTLKDNSVKIVEHKYGYQLPGSRNRTNVSNSSSNSYGNSAGQATDDTLSTVGNVLTIAHNTKVFTPKGLAKKTAKETGKAIVQDYSVENAGRSSDHPPSYSSSQQAASNSPSVSLYPSLSPDGDQKENLPQNSLQKK